MSAYACVLTFNKVLDSMLGSFETSRLILRPFEEDDLKGLAVLYSSPEVMKYVAPIRDLEQTRSRLRKYQKDREKHSFGLFATEDKVSGSGQFGLRRIFTHVNLEYIASICVMKQIRMKLGHSSPGGGEYEAIGS